MRPRAGASSAGSIIRACFRYAAADMWELSSSDDDSADERGAAEIEAAEAQKNQYRVEKQAALKDESRSAFKGSLSPFCRQFLIFSSFFIDKTNYFLEFLFCFIVFSCFFVEKLDFSLIFYGISCFFSKSTFKIHIL